MQKNRNTVVTLWVLTLLITSSMFMGLDINVFASPQTTVYIDPPYLWVLPCNDFTVDVNVEDVVDLYAWQINLTFDPSLMTVSYTHLTLPTKRIV